MKDNSARQPLISVIVPVYQVEKYLDACVESIVGQTYRNLEIILVDDGSKDHCPEMCEAWANRDGRVKVAHKANGGAASARNSGLDVASGELIGFVDPDDWLEPTMYETMLGNLLSEGADISIVASTYEYDDGRSFSNQLPSQRLVMDSAQAFKYVNMPGYYGVAPWDKLYRASLFSGLRFPEEARRNEDYEIAYLLIDRANRLVYSSERLYHYRQRLVSSSNVMTGVSLEPVRATKVMMDIVERRYPEQIWYARYGYLRAACGVYDSLLRSEKDGRAEALQHELSEFIRRYLSALKRNVSVSSARLVQFLLIAYVPRAYALAFAAYKTFKKTRAE